MTYSALDPEADRAAVQFRPAEFRSVQEIDAEIQRLFRLRLSFSSTPRETCDWVVRCAGEIWAVALHDIHGRKRTEAIAMARMAAMVIMYLDHELTCCQVAELFDRHHTTISYAVGSVQATWETDLRFRSKFATLRDRLGLKPWIKAGRVS